MTSRFHPRTWLLALLLLMVALMVGAANMGALTLSLKMLWQTPGSICTAFYPLKTVYRG